MKIFGIGLSRTGTSSLASAMKVLGFSSTHFPRSYSEIEKHEFCNDTSVACCFEFLDKTFPNSKFIYTVRDLNSWIESCKYFFPARKVLEGRGDGIFWPMIGTYRAIWFDESLFKEAYRVHDERVRSYFAERERDLLVFNVSDGDGWGKLCRFLGKEEPTFKFPDRNARRL